METELNEKSEKVKELNRNKAEIEKLKREKGELKEEALAEAQKNLSETLIAEKEKIKKTEEEKDTAEDEESTEEESTEKSQEKKPYSEVTEPIDCDKTTLRKIEDDELDSKKSAFTKTNNKKIGSHRSTISFNLYSDEDGERGEGIVFEKEKTRLKDIGLDEYIHKIKHISKKIKGNLWDIESFDKINGQVVPIRIEVKSTVTSDNYSFPMSIGEFKAALVDSHEKGRYIIYRVFEVRTSSARIETFDFMENYVNNKIRPKKKDFIMEILKKK